ncbi:MAG: RsmD family RNA methyltransferase [Bacteroidia bacterium]|nr:RsmD family RNA methyltransferase [Bacteroidia bacterium]
MRISGGEFAGRIIKGSPGTHVRPTTDRARESLFNILQNQFDFNELKVLDLFAGTGVIALEFLSRGALHVDSIDLNMKSVAFMQNLRDDFSVQNKWTIFKGNAMSWIKSSDLSAYNIIYADPPYAWEYYNSFLNLMVEKMHTGTLFCLEHERNKLLPHTTLIDEKVYGQSIISFYRK